MEISPLTKEIQGAMIQKNMKGVNFMLNIIVKANAIAYGRSFAPWGILG